MEVNKSSSELEVLAATIYAEARSQSDEGQEWVGHVILNRSSLDREYWGRSGIKNVIFHPLQFECWNNIDSIVIKEPSAYEKAKRIAQSVLNRNGDPTGGCDHYNNPAKEGYPDWTRNVDLIRVIQDHHFYRSKY